MKKIQKILSFTSLILSLAMITSCASKPEASKNSVPAEDPHSKEWMDDAVPSFCKTYADYFDKTGIAVTYGLHGYREQELAKYEVQCGIEKHCNTITLGNEFKPQFICQWWGNNPAISKETFTASNGITIETPELKGLSNVDAILNICKAYGLQVRGHVLVWHSQTEDQFFREGYKKENPLVDKDTMTAREEWYIKTVVEHIQEWEKNYNKGKPIVWAWDVVNEVVADGSSNLRSQNSKWFEIYGNDEFIVNAFRFANKYVNPDVQLVYNDYGMTNVAKRSGMLAVVKDIQAAENDAVMPTRLDAMGLQSHISVNTSVSGFETAIRDFLAQDIDVQITELDVATEDFYNPKILASKYYDLFTMFIENRKTEEKHGISSITIWGINDEGTWLNTDSQIKYHGNVKQYPLLFQMNDQKQYITKEAFWSVIQAAEDYKANNQ